jgi:hypothetical protein
LKKEQLKKALKPVIVECVREALYEEGVLSSVISEVLRGLGTNVIKESSPPPRQVVAPPVENKPSIREAEAKSKLNETRKRLLEAVSDGAYNGVNIFEGTTPTPASSGAPTPGDPLSDKDPADSGIDISGIMAVGGKKWKALSGQN